MFKENNNFQIENFLNDEVIDEEIDLWRILIE